MAKKWWTLVAVAVGTFMLMLDTTIVNTALPSIQRDFHGSLNSMQWIVDAYALVLAACLLAGGSLADRYGRRLLFAAGVAIFTLGSLLCGLATGSLFIILARGLQGVGGAIMLATSLALLGHAFRGKDRGAAFGVFGAVTGVGIAVGPLLGGVITTDVTWRWIFLINVPLGVVCAAITLAMVEESRDPGAVRVDIPGFVTFTGGVGALVYALIDSTGGWRQTGVLVGLAVAVAALIAFLAFEFAQRRPMLDLSLFRKPTFVGGLLAAFCVSGSMFALILYIVLYLQNLLGYSALGAGLRTTSITLAVLVTSTIAGRLTTVIPVKFMIGAGFALIGAGLLLMTGLNAGSVWTHLVPGMIVSGVGVGLVFVPLASTAVGVVEPARGGMASGINSTSRQLGLATGIAVYGSVFAGQLRGGVTAALQHTPLAAQATQIAGSIQPGERTGAVSATVAGAVRTGFTGAMNDILLIGGIIALLAGVASLILIRARDFIPAPSPATLPSPEAEAAAVTGLVD